MFVNTGLPAFTTVQKIHRGAKSTLVQWIAHLLSPGVLKIQWD